MQLNALTTAVAECIDVASELGYVTALLSWNRDAENIYRSLTFLLLHVKKSMKKKVQLVGKLHKILFDPGIEPRTSCSAVMLAISRLTRQTKFYTNSVAVKVASIFRSETGTLTASNRSLKLHLELLNLTRNHSY